MRRPTATLALIASAMLAFSDLGAQDVQQVRVKDLSSKTFKSSDLEITITDIVANKTFSANRKWSGRGHIKIHVENKSDSFKNFTPYDICIIDRNGYQIIPMCEINSSDDLTPISLKIAPHAKFATEYVLTDRINYPAKIYIGERLVAQLLDY